MISNRKYQPEPKENEQEIKAYVANHYHVFCRPKDNSSRGSGRTPNTLQNDIGPTAANKALYHAFYNMGQSVSYNRLKFFRIDFYSK